MFRFAIIGCGRIATRHAENIKRVGKLVAVCDTELAKAETFAVRYGGIPYSSLTKLLQIETEVDIVVICTPNGYHAEQCIKSLQSGKNVLCEKPLCIKTKDALQIIKAEKVSGKKLFVVKSMRFNPLLQDLKRLVVSNELGKVYSFQLSCFWNRPKEYYGDWHGKSNLDGGTLYTQFSHYIDAMLWLFGDLEEVTGFSANASHDDFIDFEDMGVASLKFINKVLGSINWSVNAYHRNLEIALTVIAERGTIALGGEFLNEIKYQKLASDYWLENTEKVLNRSKLSHHHEVYDNLILALHNEEYSITNALDGFKSVEAIEKIYKSITFSSP